MHQHKPMMDWLPILNGYQIRFVKILCEILLIVNEIRSMEDSIILSMLQFRNDATGVCYEI